MHVAVRCLVHARVSTVWSMLTSDLSQAPAPLLTAMRKRVPWCACAAARHTSTRPLPLQARRVTGAEAPTACQALGYIARSRVAACLLLLRGPPCHCGHESAVCTAPDLGTLCGRA